MRFRQTVGSINAAIVIIASGISLALFAVMALPAHISAQTVSGSENVQINVADTLVRIYGKTSRNAFVTIKENDSVIGTTYADFNGDYSKTIGARQRGIHSYVVNAIDNRSVFGDTATLNVNLTPYTTTSVSAFLPPTIRLSGTALQLGQNLKLSGQTVPGYGGKVVLYLDGVQRFEAIVDGFGLWNFEIQTYRFRRGTHSVSAIAYQTNGSQSYPGATHYFTVGVPSGGIPNPTPTPAYVPPGNSGTGSSKSPSPSPPRKPVTPIIFGSDGPGTRAAPQIPRVTLPLNDSVAEFADISVAGTADPNSQIEVWNEGRLTASVFVNDKGGWLVPIKLQLGANKIQARSCLHNVCSDFSSPVTVRFLDTENFSEMWLMLNESRFLVPAGSTVHLGATTIAGALPFEYEVNWGDGHHDEVAASDTKTVLSGHYDRPGDYSGVVKVTDAKNRVARSYFSVQVVDTASADMPPVLEWTVIFLCAAALVFGVVRPRNALFLLRKALAAINSKIRARLG